MRSPSTSRGVPSRPVYAGKETTGRVKSLTRGQACGMISAPDGDVFFHKADFKGEFFDLQVGDKVVFELLNDTISGKRAQNVRVAPKPAPRAAAKPAPKAAPKPAKKPAAKPAAKKTAARPAAKKGR